MGVFTAHPPAGRGLIEVTESIKCISQNFDIGFLRSGQFCDLSIISQWDKIENRLFGIKTIINILKHRVTGRIDNLNRKIATSDRSS